MLRTRIDKDFRVSIPKKLRSTFQVGDELLITLDKAGRILIIPEARMMEILEQTAGMWHGRKDIPEDGIEYVNQLRQRSRLTRLGIDEDDSV